MIQVKKTKDCLTIRKKQTEPNDGASNRVHKCTQKHNVQMFEKTVKSTASDFSHHNFLIQIICVALDMRYLFFKLKKMPTIKNVNPLFLWVGWCQLTNQKCIQNVNF